ncbi:MAG: Lrp/AsnC family transcriptional regulator [Actinobacteria bacterium]|nr:Lrp/AsnC family transcriptional regulator [Actinomycetota bacterium]
MAFERGECVTTTAANPRHHRPDGVDQELLNALQAGLPLVRRPFAAIGEAIGLTESAVIERTQRLRDAEIIRQLSAIFDTRALGYSSTLVAAAYPEERLFDAAKLVGGHPGVSHNYRRNHYFNLWFTLATEPGSEMGLEDTVDFLSGATGAASMRILPTIKLFKINVQLDMTGKKDVAEKAVAPPPPRRGDGVLPTDADRDAIVILQRDLPIVSEPFDVWATEAGIAVEALLEQAQTFVDRSYMRRFAAVLNHRKAGFGANGMAVWRVPLDRVEDVGPQMAAFRAVSHCYLRPTYDDWPYTLFTMVHARTRELCEETIDAIAEEAGLTGTDDRATLYSTYEFKKIRLVYYSPEYRAWEALARSGGTLPVW